MGSDLYMESHSFRPRPNKAEWDGDELVIMQDRFMSGYEVLWRGTVTHDNESLIKIMLPSGTIPDRPTVKISRWQTLHDALHDSLHTTSLHSSWTDDEIDALVNWIMDIFQDDEHYE